MTWLKLRPAANLSVSCTPGFGKPTRHTAYRQIHVTI